MRRRTTLALSLIALTGAAGSLLVRGVGAADPALPGAGRTAVADVLALLSAAPRKKITEADNAARKQQLDKYASDEQERIHEMYKRILTMPEADPGRHKDETAYARAKVLFEFDMKVKVAEAEAAYSSALETLYEDVRAATRQVAEEMGIALVVNLVTDRLDLRDSPNNFVGNVAARPVLYAANQLDITALVKARLEATRPSGPTPGPAPIPATGVRPPTPAGPVPPPSNPGALPPPMPGPRPIPVDPGMGMN